MHEFDLCDLVVDGPFEFVLPVLDVPEPGADVFRRVRLRLVCQRLRLGDRLLARVLYAVAVIAIREALERNKKRRCCETKLK